MEYYLAIKKNEIMPFAAVKNEPRDCHTKWSKSERGQYLIWYHSYVESNLFKEETETEISKINLWSPKGTHGWERDKSEAWDEHTNILL